MEGSMKNCLECPMGQLLLAGATVQRHVMHGAVADLAKAALKQELECRSEDTLKDLSPEVLKAVEDAMTTAMQAGYLLSGVERGLTSLLGNETAKKYLKRVA
jgi:hypothetical protein